jgi:phosphoribosyl-AMP cyclohydrolase
MTDINAQPAIPSDTFIEQFIAQLKFNEDGLIPAVAQQHDTGEVLMMAWMNSTSIAETLKNNRVCYWSRSRQSLWRKGESSGQVQLLKSFRIDCDADTLLLEVDQTGPACHTGRRSCFYQVVQGSQLITDSEPLIDPKTLYGK